jgi:Domain of unknown function (DUF4389)
MAPPNPEYPIRLEVDYPDRLSRLLIFVKWLLAIPHFVVLWLLGIVTELLVIVCWFVVLITGRWPRGLFDFVVGFERWRMRVAAYLLLQTDRYPPFSLADDPSYPVRLQVDHPERIARWRPILNWLLAIPAWIGAAILGLLAFLGSVLAWFAILITGRYPQGLFDLVTISLRWSTRVTLFTYWMTAAYPPLVYA